MNKFVTLFVISCFPLMVFSQAIYNKSYTFQEDCPLLTVLCDSDIKEGLIVCDTRFKAVTDGVFSFTDGVRTIQTQYTQSPFVDADAAHSFLVSAQLGCGCDGSGVSGASSLTGTSSVSSSTTTGSTTADIQLLSVSNVGAAAGVFDGESIPSGTTLTFTAYLDPVTNVFNRVKSFAYDATGTTFLILETP